MHVFHVHMWGTHVYHWWLEHISHPIAQGNNMWGAWQDRGIRLCTNVVKAIDKAAEVLQAEGSTWERVKHVYLHPQLTQTDFSTPPRRAKFVCVWCLFSARWAPQWWNCPALRNGGAKQQTWSFYHIWRLLYIIQAWLLHLHGNIQHIHKHILPHLDIGFGKEPREWEFSGGGHARHNPRAESMIGNARRQYVMKVFCALHVLHTNTHNNKKNTIL